MIQIELKMIFLRVVGKIISPSVFALCTCFSMHVFGLDNQVEKEGAYQENTFQQITQWEGRASKGDREAQFRLGLYYGSQSSLKPNFKQSAYWYELASEQGHPIAQYNLGTQYITGEGVEKDTEKAMLLWLKAANSGHMHAQFNVGRAYFLGVGLDENHLKARYWFEKAALQNEPKSKDLLAQLGWREQSSAVSVSVDEERHLDSLAVIAADNSHKRNKLDSSTKLRLKKTEPKQASIASAKSGSMINQRNAVNASAKRENIQKLTPPIDSNVVSKAKIAKPVVTNKARFSSNVNKKNLVKGLSVYVLPIRKGQVLSSRYESDSLQVQSKLASGWAKVKHKKGFLTWVHKDYVSVSGKKLTVTGERVLTRAEPSLAKRSLSIVGMLRKGEQLEVLSQSKDRLWYHIRAPRRLTAWVATKDL